MKTYWFQILTKPTAICDKYQIRSVIELIEPIALLIRARKWAEYERSGSCLRSQKFTHWSSVCNAFLSDIPKFSPPMYFEFLLFHFIDSNAAIFYIYTKVKNTITIRILLVRCRTMLDVRLVRCIEVELSIKYSELLLLYSKIRLKCV